MDAILLHYIPGLGITVPSRHWAYIGWGSDGGSDEGIHVYSLLCDVGNVGAPVTFINQHNALHLIHSFRLSPDLNTKFLTLRKSTNTRTRNEGRHTSKTTRKVPSKRRLAAMLATAIPLLPFLRKSTAQRLERMNTPFHTSLSPLTLTLVAYRTCAPPSSLSCIMSKPQEHAKDPVMPRSWGKPAAGEPIVPKNLLEANY